MLGREETLARARRRGRRLHRRLTEVASRLSAVACDRRILPARSSIACAANLQAARPMDCETASREDRARPQPDDDVTDNATGKTFDLPVLTGTIGPQRDRRPQALHRDRLFHLRSGLHLDRQLQSKITYIDGDKGELLYRGYPIEQLAEQSDFIEVCYLLLNGELPTTTSRRQSSSATSRTTPWCTSRSHASSAASAATPIRWP